MKYTEIDSYLSIVLKSIPRLLSLQNRCVSETNYGCFDKNYWHFKLKDFPNAAAQMGSEVLARLWNWQTKGNPYYKNDMICQWAKHGFLYLVKIQKKDGSFDEWYPNERGWAGPTGYVLHSLISGYTILERQWNKNERNKIIESIHKGASHLSKRAEGYILSNHYAMALMALYDSWEIIKKDWILKVYKKFWSEFKEYICDEGWTLEYDGVDLGYNMATLGFLGRIHARNKDKDIENYCTQSINFLSHFLYPDGSFGGRIGSRGTSHIYPFALEYWANICPVASSMVRFSNFSLLSPDIQDDHYLSYRLCDYIEAAQIRQNHTNHPSLPFLQTGNKTYHFPLAGMYIKKTPRYYFVCNLKRGGSFVLYRLSDKKLIMADSGVIGNRHSQTLSSQSCHSKWNTSIDKNTCQVKGPLVKVRNQSFTPFSFLLFRIATLLLGNSNFLSYWMKITIRYLLIVKDRTVEKTTFIRKFSFSEEKVHVKDFLTGIKGDFYTRFDFSARYVPQSRYFQKHEIYLKFKKMKKIDSRYELESEWSL